MTASAVRLNHAVLYVSDLERSIDFYEQAFGMQVMASEPRANAAGPAYAPPPNWSPWTSNRRASSDDRQRFRRSRRSITTVPFE